jgi:hypothetical protein
LAKKFKKNFGVLIISFLILSFIYNHNLFRKLYNIFVINFESRLTIKHGYCFRESVGFLRMLKKKYKFNFNPLIVNYEDAVPDSGWSIYDNHNKTDKNHKILLNYPKNLSLYFKPLNKIFYSEGTVKHSNGISNIIFDLKDNHIRIDSKIKIYRKTFDKKEIIIYEDNFHKLVKNNQIIPIEFRTKKINSLFKPTFIELSDLSEDQTGKINSIIVNLNHEFNLKDFTIIEKFNNCYYIND